MTRREPWERMFPSWLSSLAQGASPHSHFHASVTGSRPRGICAGTSQITHQAVNDKETDTLLPCSSEVLIWLSQLQCGHIIHGLESNQNSQENNIQLSLPTMLILLNSIQFNLISHVNTDITTWTKEPNTVEYTSVSCNIVNTLRSNTAFTQIIHFFPIYHTTCINATMIPITMVERVLLSHIFIEKYISYTIN